MNMDFSKFKKISEDPKSAVLKHPRGHSIKIAKDALSPQLKKMLSSLPMHYDDGGGVSRNPQSEDTSDGGSSQASQPVINIYNQDPRTAQAPAVAENSSDQAPAVPENASDYMSQLSGMGTQASMPNETKAPDYFTNGTFDTNKFILQNPDAPVQSKINTIKNEDAQKNFQANQEQRDAEKAYKQALEYNTLAQQHGLPLIPMPQMKAPMPPPGGAPNINNQDIPKPNIPTTPGTPMNNGMEDYMGSLNAGIREQESGIRQQMQAQADLGNAQSKVYQNSIDAEQKAAQQTQRNLNNINTESQKVIKDWKDGHLDQNRVFNQMGTFDRVRTAFGLILGGMAGGLLHRENPAVEAINKAVDRDIDAQKYEMNKKQNLVSAYNNVFQNTAMAANMARIAQTQIISNELNNEIAKAQSPMAKAAGMQALGQLHQRTADLRYQLAIQQTRLGFLSNPQGGAGPNDQNAAMAIRFLVPEKEQEAAFKEMAGAQEALKARDHALEVFDQVKEINTAGNRLGSPLQTKRQVDALVHNAAVQLAREEAGRVNEFEFEAAKKLFKTVGDDEDTIARKRQDLSTFNQVKINTPRLASYGIKLNQRYDPTGKDKFQLGPAVKQ